MKLHRKSKFGMKDGGRLGATEEPFTDLLLRLVGS